MYEGKGPSASFVIYRTKYHLLSMALVLHTPNRSVDGLRDCLELLLAERRRVGQDEVPLGAAICGPKPGVRACRSVETDVGLPMAECGRSLSCGVARPMSAKASRPPLSDLSVVRRSPADGAAGTGR